MTQVLLLFSPRFSASNRQQPASQRLTFISSVFFVVLHVAVEEARLETGRLLGAGGREFGRLGRARAGGRRRALLRVAVAPQPDGGCELRCVGFFSTRVSNSCFSVLVQSSRFTQSQPEHASKAQKQPHHSFTRFILTRLFLRMKIPLPISSKAFLRITNMHEIPTLALRKLLRS